MQLAGILFDKDGTLFDFQASWGHWAANLIEEFANADQVLALDLARRLEFDLKARVFHPGSFAVAGTVAEQAAAIAPALPHMDEPTLIRQLTEAAASAEMAPVPCLTEVLLALEARGLTLGVATNDAESAARAHLSRAGIAGRFSFVAGFDSGFGAKPEPGMCLAFAESAGLDPARVLMVGDSTHDLVAGRTAGMPVLAVLTGTAGPQELAPFADAVLPDISHLLRWLDETGTKSDIEGQKAT